MSQVTVKKALDREAYLKRVAKRHVPLPDGSVVCIRALPASLIVSGAEEAAKTFEAANLLVQSLCDEDGTLLFGPEETAMAMTIDHVGLKAVLDAIVDLNGLKPPAGKGVTDDAGKN